MCQLTPLYNFTLKFAPFRGWDVPTAHPLGSLGHLIK